MYNLIRISNNSGLTPEELISVLDKNNSCDMDEKELISFIEKWSRKRHQKMSEETKRFADRAFNFIDDDHDGVILGRELLPAQKTANDYAYLGSAAESVFGYFWYPIIELQNQNLTYKLIKIILSLFLKCRWHNNL